jgi:chitosanase
MPITTQQKTKILQTVNVFETGSKQGNYADVSLFKDGPKGPDGLQIRQITYGRSQTTEFGNLKPLLQMYVDNKGTLASVIKPYLPKVGKQPSLCNDAKLIQALKDAGNNDPIMRSTQDVFFDKLYYQPAQQWFDANKFTMALSMLVIYDSQVHSGGILSFLREKFKENVPVNGGDEKKWIKAYVDAREFWLEHHSNPVLHNTIYRTQCFKDAIAKNNWDLSQTIKAHGVDV